MLSGPTPPAKILQPPCMPVYLALPQVTCFAMKAPLVVYQGRSCCIYWRASSQDTSCACAPGSAVFLSMLNNLKCLEPLVATCVRKLLLVPKAKRSAAWSCREWPIRLIPGLTFIPCRDMSVACTQCCMGAWAQSCLPDWFVRSIKHSAHLTFEGIK
jgi:hypothetical protein